MAAAVPEILFSDPVMQLASFGDLFIERWTAAGDSEHLGQLVEVHRRYVQAHAPAKTLFVVHIATPEIAMPDARGREIVKEHVRVIDGHIAACCIVLTPKGLGASVFHAILSTATMLRRTKYPYRVSRDLDDAFSWLTRHRAPRSRWNSTPEDLSAMYAALEARIGRK